MALYLEAFQAAPLALYSLFGATFQHESNFYRMLIN